MVVNEWYSTIKCWLMLFYSSVLLVYFISSISSIGKTVLHYGSRFMLDHHDCGFLCFHGHACSLYCVNSFRDLPYIDLVC